VENGIAIKISGAFSRPEIAKNTIQKNSKDGVFIMDGAEPKLLENNIQDNAKAGIVIQSSAPLITHNRITRNEGNGIIVKNSHPVIHENNINDNGSRNPREDLWEDQHQVCSEWSLSRREAAGAAHP